MPSVRARAPLACSITILLFSAPWSCSVSASARAMLRSWRIAMVATSASDCTTRTSPGSNRISETQNRLRAPMA